MRQLSKREKGIFVICVLMVLAYFLYQGAFIPLKEKKDDLRVQIQSQKRKIQKNMQIISRGDRFESEYKRILEDYKQGQSNEESMSLILSQVELVASTLDLQISDMKPNRVKKDDFFNIFSVSLTISGDMKEISEFLYKLQTEPYLYDVEDLHFEKTTQRKNKDLRSRLVLSKFYVL